MVRMAEHAVSRRADDQLVSLGLGSCIGLALVDPGAGVAGLAHIVLPESFAGGQSSPPAKFADTAVPHLLKEVLRLGARKDRLQAVLCGGAHMFGGGGGATLEIGRRNQEGTLKALKALGVKVRGTSVGGSTGRSVEVTVGTGVVSVKAVGQQPVTL